MLTTNRVRFGILGTGMIAHSLAQAMGTVEGAVLAAVASRSLPKAKTFAARFGIPKSYGSYEELLKSADVDVAYIATPLGTHKDLALECLKHGVHVLLEKPFVESAEHVDAIIQAQAQSKGLFVMEALWSRFIPAMRHARELVKGGAIGDVHFMTADFGRFVRFHQGERLYNPDLGGGALFDLGIYPLSLAYYFLGAPTSQVAVAKKAKTLVDQTVAITLGYANGAVAQLSASLGANTGLGLSLYGSEGALHVKPPIFAPKAIRVERYALEVENLPAPLRLVARLSSKDRALLLAEKVARRAPACLNPFVKEYQHAFKGSGYRFEVEEVVRCLRAGLSESPLLPLSETRDIYRTMNDLAQQIGIGLG